MKQNRDRILHDNKYLGFIHLNGQNLILSNTEGVCSCRSFKVCVCLPVSSGRGDGAIQLRGHFLLVRASESVIGLKLTVSCC